MSGTLYVVATPIGNLEDITIRALRVLREVNVIAAEDTRRTARLLNRHAITTRTVSFHTHNTRSRLPQLMSQLQAGAGVALVTDAGTPGVSDPGLELVQAAIAVGVPVEPIPGASAPLAALVASGFPLIPFTVFGFPPVRPIARVDWLRQVSLTQHVFSFFEAPHRIRETLREATQYFGERQIMLGREVTKAHQEFLRGTTDIVVDALGQPRGEFTVIVGPAVKVHPSNELALTDDDVVREFGLLTESGQMSRREAVRRVAQRSGRRSKDIYSVIERGKFGANNK
jgi:16S rRNA (cytidine1402-2'-O)-methyltransferase